MAKIESKKSPVKAMSTSKGGSDNGTACAILSYFLVGIIWFFADENMRKNSFAKFHVKQALVLLIVDVIAWVAVSILWTIFAWMPVFWILGSLISTLVWLAILVLLIIGIIYSATGKEKALPVIGGFADKFSF